MTHAVRSLGATLWLLATLAAGGAVGWLIGPACDPAGAADPLTSHSCMRPCSSDAVTVRLGARRD